MTPHELRERTRHFALAILRFLRTLPRTDEARTIGHQLLRSATSVAANYRAAGRGRSGAEFISKIGIAVEEADETVFWIELLRDAGIAGDAEVQPLIQEAGELLRILVASQQTARRRKGS